MKKGIVAILVSAIALMSLTTFFISGDAFNVSSVVGALQAEYKIGTTVSIPDAKINVAGKEYDAQKVLITPDGKAYSTDIVIADKLGIYTVEYRVMVEGKLYTDKKTFETFNDLYSVTGKGTAEYGKETRYNTNIDGLHISLHEGEKFTYNEIIDLRDFDYETPFIELFATPNKLGTRDVHAFSMRLTDAHDSTNYVTIDAKSVNTDGGANLWWMNFIFVAAGPNGNSLKGIEWGKNLVHTDNSFGFPIKYSLYGTLDNKNTVGKNFFELCYDITENKIYGPLGKSENFAIDLDDPQYFANGWRGFTTGEVYLSISGLSYYAPSFNFTVKKIGNSNLSEKFIYDREKPEITINCDEIPLAGLNTGYPVFTAEAIDGYSGKIPVTAKVFYNYRGDNRYELPISNGIFIPNKAGSYTIEYTATDSAGNSTVETVSVLCGGIDRTLNLNVNGLSDVYKTGESIKLSTPLTTGGIGTVSIQTTVKHNDTVVDVRNNQFVPQTAGDYTVSVVATDMIGQTVTKTYTVNVVINDRPVIEHAILPDFFVSGSTYRLPTLFAYNYSTERRSVCTLKINGQTIANGLYTVPQDVTEAVDLVYSTGNESKTYTVPVITYESYASLFVSDGKVHDGVNGVILFDGEFKFANELSSDFDLSVNVQANSQLNLTLTDFIDEDISVDFALSPGKHNVVYDKVLNKLTVDGKEMSKTVFGNGVRLTGFVDGSAVVESINGQNLYGDVTVGTKISVNGFYSSKVAHGGKIEVLAATGYNVLNPGGVCNVTVIDPKGSTVINDKAYNTYSVDVTMFGQYTITYTVGDATVSYKMRVVDRTAPQITVGGALNSNIKSGETLTVPHATAIDNLDGAVNVECYVVCPSGMTNPIYLLQESQAKDGIIVRFSETGNYKIKYFAVDSEGNYSVQTFEIFVTV